MLGLTLLDGRGELLTFGGQVMKNVAGYDVSRLIAGSWGVLGVICEVSLKVLAAPADSATLEFEWDEPRALEEMARWRAQPLPLQASAWCEGRLRIRLAGSRAAVLEARARLGGTALDPEGAFAFWESVRDQRHEFFAAAADELDARHRLVATVGAADRAAFLVGRPSIRRMGRRAALVAHGGTGGGSCAPRQRAPEVTRRWCARPTRVRARSRR